MKKVIFTSIRHAQAINGGNIEIIDIYSFYGRKLCELLVVRILSVITLTFLPVGRFKFSVLKLLSPKPNSNLFQLLNIFTTRFSQLLL